MATNFDSNTGPRLPNHLRRAITFAAFGGFVDGYNLLILSASLILLVPYFHLTALQTGFIGGSAYLGSFFGAMIFGYFTDLRGRRSIFLLDMALFVIFSILSGLVVNVATLLIARFLLGFFIGMDFPTAGAMIAEFSPAKTRGAQLARWQLLWVLGALAAPIVGILLLPMGGDAWRWMLMSGAVPAAIVLIGRRNIPETPRWLLSQNRGDDARRAAEWAGIDPEVVPSVQSTTASVREKTRRIFGPQFGKVTMVITIVMFAAAFGPLFLGTYSSYLAKFYGFTSNTQSLEFSMVVWIAYLVANLINMGITDKIGRKPLLIIGTAIVTVSLGVASRLPLTDIGLVLVVFVVAAIGHWGGVDQAVWQYPAELFPTDIRATARGWVTSWGRMSAFLSAVVTPVILKDIGFGPTMLIFAGVELIAFSFSFALPEVKGRTLEEIAADIGGEKG